MEDVAYRLALPPSLEGAHNVLHVSHLRKYVKDESHVLNHSELELQPDLSYKKQPMAILDRSVKTLKNQAIPLVLVSWNRHAQEKLRGNERILFVSVTPNSLQLSW